MPIERVERLPGTRSRLLTNRYVAYAVRLSIKCTLTSHFALRSESAIDTAVYSKAIASIANEITRDDKRNSFVLTESPQLTSVDLCLTSTRIELERQHNMTREARTYWNRQTGRLHCKVALEFSSPVTSLRSLSLGAESTMTSLLKWEDNLSVNSLKKLKQAHMLNGKREKKCTL